MVLSLLVLVRRDPCFVDGDRKLMKRASLYQWLRVEVESPLAVRPLKIYPSPKVSERPRKARHIFYQ